MKNLQLRYSYEIREDGKLIKAIKPKKCKSFTNNWAAIMYGIMGGGFCSITDVDNSTINACLGVKFGAAYTCNMSIASGAGAETSGIQVGTGTTAPTIDDYVMETLIAHGSSASQLQYAACTVGSASSDASDATFRATRVFTNASGGSITVEEIGIVMLINYDQGSGAYALIVRDVTGGIAVANTQSLTLNYDFTTSL